MNQSRYILAAILTFFLWGFFSFGLRPISHYPSMDILYYRLFFSTILLLFIGFLFRRRIIKRDFDHVKSLSKKERRSIILHLIGGSLVLMGNWLSFIYVMNHVNVQTASLSYLICPILTTLLSVFILSFFEIFFF